MSALPRSYRTIEDFEREEIRPSFRIGFSIDDLEETSFEGDHAFGVEKDEFQLDSLLVHRCGFELVVVVAGNWLVTILRHGDPPDPPALHDRCRRLCYDFG